tara:strand:+ start:433 stop:747 length:315 start_codon:yes stop_codon:yes gene_type:complete
LLTEDTGWFSVENSLMDRYTPVINQGNIKDIRTNYLAKANSIARILQFTRKEFRVEDYCPYALDVLSCLIFKCRAAKNRVVKGLNQLNMAYTKYSATPTPNTPD